MKKENQEKETDNSHIEGLKKLMISIYLVLAILIITFIVYLFNNKVKIDQIREMFDNIEGSRVMLDEYIVYRNSLECKR